MNEHGHACMWNMKAIAMYYLVFRPLVLWSIKGSYENTPIAMNEVVRTRGIWHPAPQLGIEPRIDVSTN